MKRGWIITIIVGLITIFLLLIILTLISISKKSTDSFNECRKVSEENLQSCCDNWARENNIIVTMCLGKWKIKDKECSWECEEISVSLKGCSEASEEEMTTCCETAAENKMVSKPECEGHWELQRGECYWICLE